MANYVKFMRGTVAAYEKLKVKDDDTLYFLSNNDGKEGYLYLGTKLIAGPDSEIGENGYLGQLADVMITPGIDYDAILMYDSIEMKWRDYSFDALTFTAGTETVPGASGFVPAPGADERNKFLRGDGTWASVSSSGAQIFDAIQPTSNQTHAEALQQHTTGHILNKGDIAIIQDFISNDKYQYTSYIYDGTKWCAMDGNYNAENVYFSKNMIFTEPVGTITIPSSGRAQVESEGKSVKQLLENIFAQSKNPETIQPSLTISTPNNKKYEVGTTIYPSYTGDYTEGVYSFDESTGVTVAEWKAVDSRGEEIEAQSGVFTELIIEDDTYYTIQLSAKLSDGIIPHTNLGEEYPDGQIIGETQVITSNDVISGYRKSFWGALDEKASLTSDIIRSDAFQSSSYALINGSSFTIDVPVGALRVVIAYPASLQNLTMVLDANDSNSNIVSGFGNPSILSIEGANNYEAIEYKVYIMDFANPYDTANKFKVTI